jgi:replicative DNA helicase
MDTFVSFGATLSELTIETVDARKADSWLSGTSTGISELDNILGGLHPSELIVIGGRPSNGKTSLATNIAYNVAKSLRAATAEPPGAVAFFSLEMTAAQIARRILSEQSTIASADIRRGMITDDDAQNLATISNLASSIPLYFDHSGSLSIDDLCDRARQLKLAKGLNLIVVDYLQLVSTATSNRFQAMTEVTARLKSLAKELAVPVLVLSQVSRDIDQREDKRPQLSDLRETRSIEQAPM